MEVFQCFLLFSEFLIGVVEVVVDNLGGAVECGVDQRFQGLNSLILVLGGQYKCF